MQQAARVNGFAGEMGRATIKPSHKKKQHFPLEIEKVRSPVRDTISFQSGLEY
jgi:hypothetical protein